MTTHTIPSSLDDGVVRIRRHALADVDPLLAAARESIAEVGRWLPWLDELYVRSECRAWIEATISAWEAGEQFGFVIEGIADGRLLGGVGLNPVNHSHRMANLGYWVRSSSTSRGVASRAASLVAEFGLNELGLTRLEILCLVENLRSQRVAEKIGAAREGTLRNRLVLRERAHDAVMYSITPGWRSRYA